jgi:hypothetical protein
LTPLSTRSLALLDDYRVRQELPFSTCAARRPVQSSTDLPPRQFVAV